MVSQTAWEYITKQSAVNAAASRRVASKGWRIDLASAFAVAEARSILHPLLATLLLAAAFTALCFVMYSHAVWLTMASPLLVAVLSLVCYTVYMSVAVDLALSC